MIYNNNYEITLSVDEIDNTIESEVLFNYDNANLNIDGTSNTIESEILSDVDSTTLVVDDIGSKIDGKILAGQDSAVLNIADFQAVNVNDHNLLENRDLPNQHPISAITNLNGKLENKVETKSVIPDSYIDNL